MPQAYADAIHGFYGEGFIDETTVNPTVEEITGHPARPLQEWVSENAERFS
ncbi:hypothetical protein [Kribbella sp. NPDC051770]|uniref:hypothetical protein n=1 Tax=Kribbella sp. NPDC051770 TaxID=3155413 RepID=UPI00343EC5B0